MVRVTIANLKEGQVLAEPVQAQGRVLLAAGVTLNQNHLRIFKTWGVAEAVIEGDAAETSGKEGHDFDPEKMRTLRAEIERRFEKCDPKDDVIAALKKTVMKRAVEGYIQTVPPAPAQE
jgi:hypothetical protein